MKRIIVIPFVVLLIFSTSVISFGQDKKMDIKKKVEGKETKITDTKQEVEKIEKKIVDNKPVNTVCIVSGEEIDPEITATYNGKTYAFCCKTCLKKFNKNPEKYVSKLNEDEKSVKQNK